MVGYDKNVEEQLSDLWHGLAGVLSGMTTRFLTQPLDVLKIRFQLQHEPIIPNCKDNYYWSLKQALKRILREESYRALWKGHVPAQFLSGVYGLVQFGTFEHLTKSVATNLNPGDRDAHKTAVYFFCGSLSGAVATAASLPFDTVRTRLVGQGEPKVYRGVYDAFRKMANAEGISSFYKGLVPALIQIMPLAGIQFASFHVLSSLSKMYLYPNQGGGGDVKLPFWHNILCGSAAGLVAKLVVYPLDLTKKRLQVQGFEDARSKFGKVNKYTGCFHCLRSVVVEEGILGLYKGISPSLIKAMLTSGLMFGFYEHIVAQLRDYNQSHKR